MHNLGKIAHFLSPQGPINRKYYFTRQKLNTMEITRFELFFINLHCLRKLLFHKVKEIESFKILCDIIIT